MQVPEVDAELVEAAQQPGDPGLVALGIEREREHVARIGQLQGIAGESSITISSPLSITPMRSAISSASSM
jgi:hypothetical protein